MICCLPACSMDLLVTSTVACIACFYDTVLMLPWIYCIHAYVLSYASANCMLAYMLLHRGICTFGALFRGVFDTTELSFDVALSSAARGRFRVSTVVKIFNRYRRFGLYINLRNVLSLVKSIGNHVIGGLRNFIS